MSESPKYEEYVAAGLTPSFHDDGSGEGVDRLSGLIANNNTPGILKFVTGERSQYKRLDNEPSSEEILAIYNLAVGKKIEPIIKSLMENNNSPLLFKNYPHISGNDGLAVVNGFFTHNKLMYRLGATERNRPGKRSESFKLYCIG